MKPRRYKIDLSPYELFKILLYKKECPLCNARLKLKKKKISTEEGSFNSFGVKYYGNINSYKPYFLCEKCKKEISIMDLKRKG